MQPIYVITTGGTIEKVYSEQTGNVQNLDSKIDRYFRMLRLPDAEIAVTHLMNKDSLEMTDADRERVLATVRKSWRRTPRRWSSRTARTRWLKPGCCSKEICPSSVIPLC